MLPTSGRVTVGGYDAVKQERAVRACIGLSAESDRSFYWRLSGRQNLEFFAALQGLGRGRAARRIVELAELHGLTSFLDTRFMEYSTGMKRKLSFARAMLLDPPVVMLDEPTSNVDPKSADEMRARISDLRREGKTIVLTSHNMSEVQRLADRIGILQDGKMSAEGRMEDLQAILGKSVIHLLTSSAPAGLFATLGLLDGVDTIEHRDGACKLIVRDGVTVLNEVLRVVVSQGVPLQDIRVERPSLEDVFFFLTEGTEAA
jgi:ABC-2 type transport system ATP-binding protein